MSAPEIINENQRRAIASTFAFMDEMLCDLEQWAKGRESRSVLYEERNDLSAEQRRRLILEIKRLRKRLEKPRDLLRLPKTVRSAAVDIWSRCSAFQVTLMELEGKRLAGYGELSPALERLLEKLLTHLADGIDRLISIARGEKAGADTRPP